MEPKDYDKIWTTVASGMCIMNYLDFLEKNVFSGRVENQSVLELGALNSKITNVIGRCNPNSIYTVDPESSEPDITNVFVDIFLIFFT